MIDVETLIARWNTEEGRPFKGRLIDIDAYRKEPENIGCMCAQGQALHLIGGFSPEALLRMSQFDADTETMRIFSISRAHAALLRVVNDSSDGAPASVIVNPELILGDQAATVLAFWKHLDGRGAASDAAWDAAWGAASDAAWGAARDAVGDAAWDAAGAASWHDALAASWATSEIQGAAVMRANGTPFFFLPMFGFSCPEDIGALV
jgi:hypothetical protein